MAGRLAIDFGTSNTVLANWDQIRQQGVAFPLLNYGRFLKIGDERVSLIPSLIHYQSDGSILYGNQVVQRNLTNSQRTFQWMKRYISLRSPATRKIDGQNISHFVAAEALLSEVIRSAIKELRIEDEEIAVTVPVEAFEHYESWIHELASNASGQRIRLIDEPSAAALGYSARLFANQAYLVFDFGGGTLDISIVRQEEPSTAGQSGRSRVLGKAGNDLGGTVIDEWLFEEVLNINGCNPSDPEIEQISRLLLAECELLKEKLSSVEKAELTVMNPITGSLIAAQFDRQQFESLLERKSAYVSIEHTLQRALNAARERGFEPDDIKMVLMVGGCSQIPSVQELLRSRFGSERVRMERPLDAVARGAAAFVSGEGFDDYLQHEYAVRMINSSTNAYEYKPLVRRGTAYPSSEPLASLTVKATQNHQEMFGFFICEINGEDMSPRPIMEILFTESGNARLVKLNQHEQEGRSIFCLNEKQPFFLEADAPAYKGEACFEVIFGLDSNRRLLISTKDLKSGKNLHKDFPLVKLN